MARRLDRKWRPSLLMVLGGALAAVLTLPMLGLFALRMLAPDWGFRLAALTIGVVVLLATAVLAFLLWRLLLRPIQALALRAARIRAGHAVGDQVLKHFGTQELRDLGQSVLDMGATLQNRESTIRSFTDHVTHELKTPLTAIKGAGEMLEDGEPADPRLLATIRAAVAQMERQLVALRRVAAAREPMAGGKVRLDDLALDLRAAHPGLEIVIDGGQVALPIAAARLEAALTQLLANAAQHGAGRVVMVAGDAPELIVEDDGPGISDGNRDRIFAPFFTTRRETGGTGMGLNIAQAILQAQGAEIMLLPERPGAAFLIRF
jgi:two-component system, OmpR family, sensor kinase